MGAKTEISWTDATWNPVIGCSKVSEGCKNCYAERVAGRFETGPCSSEWPYGQGYYSGVIKGGKWTGRTARKQTKFNPLTARKPRTIFVCSMGDLFHARVPDEWIDAVMDVIQACPQHRFMILTKRPKRMLDYMVRYSADGTMSDSPETKAFGGIHYHTDDLVPKNLALGVSIENQATADERVPILLQTPAVKRFVSIEPALGPVDLRYLQPTDPPTEINALEGTHGVLRPHGGKCDKLDLVIMGGESGPNARPMRPDWARSMRDQCQAAGVPFHFKQWGEWVTENQSPVDIVLPSTSLCPWIDEDDNGDPHGDFTSVYRVGKKAAGRLLDGIEINGTIDWGSSC